MVLLALKITPALLQYWPPLQSIHHPSTSSIPSCSSFTCPILAGPVSSWSWAALAAAPGTHKQLDVNAPTSLLSPQCQNRGLSLSPRHRDFNETCTSTAPVALCQDEGQGSWISNPRHGTRGWGDTNNLNVITFGNRAWNLLRNIKKLQNTLELACINMYDAVRLHWQR